MFKVKKVTYNNPTGWTSQMSFYKVEKQGNRLRLISIWVKEGLQSPSVIPFPGVVLDLFIPELCHLSYFTHVFQDVAYQLLYNKHTCSYKPTLIRIQNKDF